METLPTTINPIEYGLESNKANELIGNLPQIKSERGILEKMYDEVILLNIDDPETALKARELRLKVRDNRTKGIEVWHKDAKAFFLKGGQFVDALKRVEIAVNQTMEENLEKIEKHAEIKEKERKEELKNRRVLELEPFNAFVPIGINLGELSDEEYAKILNGAKLQFQQQQEEDRKKEEERQRQIEIKKLHDSRKEELLNFWRFVENKEQNFGELSNEEFSTIKSSAEKLHFEYETEQEKIRKQNEKLEKEKADAEEKARKLEQLRNERAIILQPYIVFIRNYNSLIEMPEKEFNKELSEIKKGAEEHWEFERKEQIRLQKEEEKRQNDLKIERENQAKLAAELQAKKDEEERVEKERLAEEKRKKEEIEKLAKAPLKEQLSSWVSSFTLPEINTGNEKENTIKEKFEAFKNWAQKEIENL